MSLAVFPPVLFSVKTMSSLDQLVIGSIDYAGLFPPASLPIEQVLENFANYVESNDKASLGRLVLPTRLLDQVRDQKVPARISALVPAFDQTSAFQNAVLAIDQFNESESGSVVDAIEVKVNSVEGLRHTLAGLPKNVNSFLELPLEQPQPFLEAISNSKHDAVFAKARMGGVTPDLIPSTKTIAAFISNCAQAGVGFKATAGLHHPMRGNYRLTYAEDAPTATMHGYLNVFVAAVIAFEHRPDQERIQAILDSQQFSAFRFEPGSLCWEDLEVSTNRIEFHRRSSIISFGSCSFTEPTDELNELKKQS
jgi:hypothetical protein